MIEPPDAKSDLALAISDSYVLEDLRTPKVFETATSLPPIGEMEVVDLLHPLEVPRIDGSIYVKTEVASEQVPLFRSRIAVKPVRPTVATDPKSQRGLNIFELLLPILVPPVGYEFEGGVLFPADLYGFQKIGVKWLYETESALLADDMGLGKTVQAITAFRALVRSSRALQALVICPKSVLPNWMREVERWAQELTAVRVYGSQQERRLSWHAFVGKCHLLVTTYDTVRQDIDMIGGRPFDLIVVDEIQRIKNSETATAKAIAKLQTRRRWGLTGTPLENDLEDLAGVFGFIKPGLFKKQEARSISSRQARERIKPYMLRRRKGDALPDLPKKVIDTKWLELTEVQRQAYDRAENEGVVRLREKPDVTITHILALIQRLKQICNFDPETEDSCKLEFLGEYLEGACTERQKAIVVSQYVETLQRIEKAIGSFSPLLFSGELTLAQRVEIERLFEGNDDRRVLLLSLRAGGVGLNLSRANYVLHFDRWWNPAVERQAEDRTHRIGQKRTVFVTRLICQGTIEERIERLLERKNKLFKEVIDELADINLERILSEEELFGLFGLEPPRRTKVLGPKERPKAKDEGSERKAIVVRPEEPYSNLLQLRQILRDCQHYLWWADMHFRARGLEEIVVSVDPANVKEVRILSGPANVDDRAKNDFSRFREEMERKGIITEWRVLKAFAHDRYIISESACYNVPPIDSILRGSYGELLQTPNRPPFEDWWTKATPLVDFLGG